MRSKIDVDPLLAALFDLPASVQGSSNGSNGDSASAGTPITSSTQPRDDGMDTDTSLPPLHGESISLTDDEEYSDALAVSENAPSSFTALPVNPESYARGGKIQSFINIGHQPVLFSREHGAAQMQMQHYQKFPLGVGNCLDEVAGKGREIVPARKKKKRRSPIKSLKKFVGRKSKPSARALQLTSSSEELDTDFSATASDAPSSNEGGNTQSLNSQRNGDVASLEKISILKSNVDRIRSTIHSLELDLIKTRNELAKANQQLHAATVELNDVQRAALGINIGLSKFADEHGGLQISPLHFMDEGDLNLSARSLRSASSSLHYFTPTSSFVESEDGSECFTPRSRLGSYDSFQSFNETDNNTGTPIFDYDATPLTKNCNPRRKEHRHNGIGTNLTYDKESNSIDTRTTASLQEEGSLVESSGKSKDQERSNRRVSFSKPPSFIRSHDLVFANEALANEDNTLLALHKSDVSGILDALFARGCDFALDDSSRWSPQSTTEKILSKRSKAVDNGEQPGGPMGDWPNAANGDEVLVWTSTLPDDSHHGSEYPVVKARGIIPTTASNLVELLLDSGKVKEYNKMSLGRIDEHYYAEGVNRQCSVTGIQGEAKIVRSKSQPPLIRKPVELRLLLHARRLSLESEGESYLTIGRSVWETEHGTVDEKDASATRCEMLLSVNLVRDVVGGDGHCCEVTSITHGVSPGIPVSIGKRIAITAAAKYIRDIRAVFEN